MLSYQEWLKRFNEKFCDQVIIMISVGGASVKRKPLFRIGNQVNACIL